MNASIKIVSALDVPTPTRYPVTNGGNPDRNVFENEFDPREELPSAVIVETVSFIRNVDPLALDPLADALDPDALDALLSRSASEDPIEVTFPYEGFQISVTSDGKLWIRWDG